MQQQQQLPQRKLMDVTVFNNQLKLYTTLSKPAHLTLERMYRKSTGNLSSAQVSLGAIADTAKETTPRRTRTQSALGHDCTESNCPLIYEFTPSFFTSLTGFSSEPTITTCHNKIIGDAVENVSVIFQTESTLTSSDLQAYKAQLEQVQKATSSSDLQDEYSLPPSELDTESNVVNTLEVPSALNSMAAINERKRLARDFIRHLDSDGGIVVIRYLPKMHRSMLDTLRETLYNADQTRQRLDMASVLGRMDSLDMCLPVDVISVAEGNVRLHMCNMTDRYGWSFQPTSEISRLHVSKGYKYRVYVPDDALSKWAPTVTVQGGLPGSGMQTATGQQGGFDRSNLHAALQLNTPQHVIYPSYVSWVQSATAARRVESYNSFPDMIFTTKHDTKGLTAMSEVERNTQARMQVERDRALQERSRVGLSAHRLSGNPLLSTQLIPGELVTVSRQFSQFDTAREMAEAETLHTEYRVTTFYNSAGEAERGLNGTGGNFIRPGFATVNPTPTDPISRTSKQLGHNSYEALQSALQQAANVPAKAATRLPAQMYNVAREFQLAHTRPAAYVGVPPAQAYEAFRNLAAEQYCVPATVLKSGVQGQWGMSRNIPLFSAFNRNMITAVFNIESRGYGEFITGVHSELGRFFLFLYEVCFAEFDGQLIDDVMKEEFKRSGMTHDALVAMHNEYETHWKEYEKQLEELRTLKEEKAAEAEKAGDDDDVDDGGSKNDETANTDKMDVDTPQLTTTDIRKKKELLKNIEMRMRITHRQYMQITQYLYLLTLASHGKTRLVVDFIPTKRFMDALEQERINQEMQMSTTAKKGSGGGGGGGSSRPPGAGGAM